jgi:hypothetical protein
MKRLGYTRYVAQGGDWGALIVDIMAVQAPPELLGIHTNMAGAVPPDIDKAAFTGAAPPPDLSAEERHAYDLKKEGLPEHLTLHLLTMAELHRAGRYDRLADGVERVTGRPAMSVRKFVSLHTDQFGGRRS